MVEIVAALGVGEGGEVVVGEGEVGVGVVVPERVGVDVGDVGVGVAVAVGVGVGTDGEGAEGFGVEEPSVVGEPQATGQSGFRVHAETAPLGKEPFAEAPSVGPGFVAVECS